MNSKLLSPLNRGLLNLKTHQIRLTPGLAPNPTGKLTQHSQTHPDPLKLNGFEGPLLGSYGHGKGWEGAKGRKRGREGLSAREKMKVGACSVL